jgi:hypothetical protein
MLNLKIKFLFIWSTTYKMNSNKLVTCLLDLIDDTKVILTKDIETKTTKEERSLVLEDVKKNIQRIDKDYKKIVTLSKKNNANKVKIASKLPELQEAIANIKELNENQIQKLNSFSVQKTRKTISNRETKLISFSQKQIDPLTRKFLGKETEKYQKGVETTKEILQKVQGINATLDEVTDLVRLQKYKLLSISSKIKESQSIMKRSHKIMKAFSKELYNDKIIKVLLGIITLILILIMVSAVMYKMKSAELIGHTIETIKNTAPDYSDINEGFFWKTIYEKKTVIDKETLDDDKLKEQSKLLSGGIDLMRLNTLRKKLKEINENAKSKGEDSFNFI